jgi:hypothetical protein
MQAASKYSFIHQFCWKTEQYHNINCVKCFNFRKSNKFISQKQRTHEWYTIHPRYLMHQKEHYYFSVYVHSNLCSIFQHPTSMTMTVINIFWNKVIKACFHAMPPSYLHYNPMNSIRNDHCYYTTCSARFVWAYSNKGSPKFNTLIFGVKSPEYTLYSIYSLMYILNH